jgi:hypothetical protein
VTAAARPLGTTRISERATERAHFQPAKTRGYRRAARPGIPSRPVGLSSIRKARASGAPPKVRLAPTPVLPRHVRLDLEARSPGGQDPGALFLQQLALRGLPTA